MQQKAPEAITVMWYLLINANIPILKVLKLLFSHGKITLYLPHLHYSNTVKCEQFSSGFSARDSEAETSPTAGQHIIPPQTQVKQAGVP